MEYIALMISLATLLIAIIILLKVSKVTNDSGTLTRSEFQSELKRFRAEQTEAIQSSARNMGELLSQAQNARNDAQNKTLELSLKAVSESMTQTKELLNEQFAGMNRRLGAFTADNEQRMENIRKNVSESMDKLRDENNRRLDEMRRTVDEKLQTELERRFKESFAAVGKMLGDVQTQIGSMQELAKDVGGLKRTLSNVKSRGMMGEFQLESILRDIFSSDQYVKNAHPIPESAEVVEFAVRIPTEDDDTVLLPIDSKFPRERYDAVLAASDSCDKAQLDIAIKAYLNEIKREAKDISEKYIVPPYTTDYALLFLPTESMYAEAVNHDMLQEVWRTYHVYLAGPSTLSALLSSLQLAFNNVAIQKRAGEVFGILSEVKREFGKFGDVLNKMQTHLNQANDDLSALIGVRSRQINRRLNSIARLNPSEQEQAALPEPDDDFGN